MKDAKLGFVGVVETCVFDVAAKGENDEPELPRIFPLDEPKLEVNEDEEFSTFDEPNDGAVEVVVTCDLRDPSTFPDDFPNKTGVVEAVVVFPTDKKLKGWEVVFSGVLIAAAIVENAPFCCAFVVILCAGVIAGEKPGAFGGVV